MEGGQGSRQLVHVCCWSWLWSGRDEGGGWYACGTKPIELPECLEMPEHFPSAR